MKRAAWFWGLHAEPPKWLKVVLTLLPFIILIAIYLIASHIRLLDNPDDKFLPSPTKMVESVYRMAFTEDQRTGKYLMLEDTIVSLKRLGTGLSLAAVFGLLLGLNMGLFPGMKALLLPFNIFLAIIPPLAVLPVLFIVFGVDELVKVVLVFIGTSFVIAISILRTAEKIPREQITKALTLGASQLGVVYRVALPQMMPVLINAVRLSMGAAWLFLIAAEAIASTDGLGYRIYLVRRFLAMDIIIPYVLWITFLGYAMDWILKKFVSRKYPWYQVAEV
ncbi:MAG: lipid kinase [Candidatus Sungbacteria bacterium RIFCSPLOWO2_12_FULL_41_11]|uniref:Lipid kinase n=1 Tax=Candidatus Sungbacteria bacterium RIFCSPLOWO2_12_FULL_41_11 TaxID=1802286 RepID=A0A1G2LSK6_9BACT|nr:MAG: Binding-protein-dependent transport system inner membrane component [Parcubacteria group bacterium GW2011_GWA2_42_14]OHA14587.1 MAG: lipid kinase [Candidatus Sungbacteria bacterium RIFCSPLOWO2_12_FULL_41_11]